MSSPENPQVSAPRVLSPIQAGAPIVTAWETPAGPPPDVGTALDQLADVDAAPDEVGVLERQADQKIRPVTRTALFAEHVNSPTPHPVYDDAPSFVLLFENGLV